MIGAAQAPYVRNLPGAGSFVSDPALFARLTERNVFPAQPLAFPGFGSFVDYKVANVGILSRVELVFDGTITTASTPAITPTALYPWNLVSRLILSANGQNNLLDVDGLDLRARDQRVNRNPTDNLSSFPAAGGSPFNTAAAATLRIAYDIPIAHDQTTILGALFMQTDDNFVNVRINTAQSSDLFTISTGTLSITGSFYPILYFFSIPTVPDAQGSARVVLPDLTMLHSMVSIQVSVAANGEVVTPLQRTIGNLLCLYTRVENGATAVDPIGAPVTVTQHALRYGGNITPQTWQRGALGLLNQREYNGIVAPTANRRYAILDLEQDNPLRDVIVPKGVQDLQWVLTYAGVAWNAGALQRTVQEVIYAVGGA
jgi:hypothetical protein